MEEKTNKFSEIRNIILVIVGILIIAFIYVVYQIDNEFKYVCKSCAEDNFSSVSCHMRFNDTYKQSVCKNITLCGYSSCNSSTSVLCDFSPCNSQ